jgi:hypothetical protein
LAVLFGNRLAVERRAVVEEVEGEERGFGLMGIKDR